MEILDIVDEHGEPTGEVIDRAEAHLEGIMHRTSHVWLLRNRDDKTQILLQKRCSTKDSFPGCFDISSAGHIPAGCGFEESAVRELKEELGIDVCEEELIFCGDRTIVWDNEFRGVPFHDRQYSRVFCIWNDMSEEAFVLQKEEVECVLWTELDDCIDAVRSDRIRHCIFPEELEMVKRTAEKPEKN